MTTKSVIRGGSWDYPAGDCRSAYRGRDFPSSRYYDRGFRVVKEKKVEYRVYRGGGWNSAAGICRSAFRLGYLPSYRNFNLGFRVIKDMA
tara:strand:- start:824 stop:1093 length:270 start_codon:yes stop_codon:yes gene_type:complete